jgi:hypothetical protein
MYSNARTDAQWHELVREADQAKISGAQMAIFATNPELENFVKKDMHFYQVLVEYIFVTAFSGQLQPAFEWINTEIDSASMSDHPIAQAFVSHVEKLGFGEELYKGALKKFDSNPVECAQKMVNKWIFSHFELESNEIVAFKTGLVLAFIEEWIHANNEAGT